MKTNKNGNWKLYWGTIPLPQGAEAIGTVTRETGEIGALIRMQTGIYSMGNAGVLRSLPQAEVKAATQRSEAAAAMGSSTSAKKTAANRAKGSLGGYPKGVVTWQDTRGNTIRICKTCQKRLEASGEWPRNQYGEQYASVSHGLHKGTCDVCGK